MMPKIGRMVSQDGGSLESNIDLSQINDKSREDFHIPQDVLKNYKRILGLMDSSETSKKTSNHHPTRE